MKYAIVIVLFQQHQGHYMIFKWLKERRRKEILKTPFPEEWRQIIESRVFHYQYLNQEEKHHLEQMIQVFVEEKNFEGCGGITLTDEIIITISSEACMLLLGLGHNLYKKLDSILVYPSTVVTPETSASVFSGITEISRDSTPILGQAFMGGPVILVWDAVKQGAKHPDGHNVVYHEFAHIIDMYDGRADGTPLLSSKSQYKKWAEICTREFTELKERSRRGKKSFLNSYGATNEPEFFAVATEYFFEKPVKMKQKHPSLYTLLQSFYNQDPAARM